MANMTQAMAIDGDRRVFASMPSQRMIDAGMSKPIFENPKVRAVRGGGVPLRCLGEAADIAEAVLFLDSDGANTSPDTSWLLTVSTSVMAHLPANELSPHIILVVDDFQASAEALADLLTPLESRIESDLDTGLASLATDPVDLITVNALRWEMIGEKYDPYRDSEAYSPLPQLAPPSRTILRRRRCWGFTASICFSDWPEWVRGWAAAGFGAPASIPT